MTRLSRALTALFALGFGAALYAGAATASLDDRYQPGISWLKVGPALTFLALAALLGAAAAWTARRRELARTLQRAFAATFAAGLAVGAGILLAKELGVQCGQDWPANRGLVETLRTSTLCPSFSTRSYGLPFEVALLSPALYAIARHLAHGATQRRPAAVDRVAAAFVGGLALAATPFSPLVAFGLLSHMWPGPGDATLALTTVGLGLALQFLLAPFVGLCMRLRAPLWLGPAALWGMCLGILQAVDWANPQSAWTWVGVAIYAAFPALALLSQLAVLRTPLSRGILTETPWPRNAQGM